jgi:hypothetical protein
MPEASRTRLTQWPARSWTPTEAGDSVKETWHTARRSEPSRGAERRDVFEVTVQIELADGDDYDCAHVGSQLAKAQPATMAWHPSMNGRPARATFGFPSEELRDAFLLMAVTFPGVTIQS